MTKYEYKCVRIKKNGLCKLIMNVCKKNVVLPREWAGIVVGIWSHHGMPRFECFSCSETAFVDYGGVVKVNGMVIVSIELRVSWKAVTPFFLMMQKLSST